MTTNTEGKTVELLSLVEKDTGEVHVPQGVTALYDAVNGPLKLKGKLTNDGEIAVTAAKTGTAVIVASAIVNHGTLTTEAKSLSLCSKAFENQGHNCRRRHNQACRHKWFRQPDRLR